MEKRREKIREGKILEVRKYLMDGEKTEIWKKNSGEMERNILDGDEGKNKGRSGDKNTWRKKYCSEGEKILETWRDGEKKYLERWRENTMKERDFPLIAAPRPSPLCSSACASWTSQPAGE